MQRIRALSPSDRNDNDAGMFDAAPRQLRRNNVGDDAHVDAVLSQMVFPLLYICAEQWVLLLARPAALIARPSREVRVVVYTGITSGDTSSVVGTYQLLKELRALRNWVYTVYRSWWETLPEGIID